MKKLSMSWMVVLLALCTLSSCEVIGGVFKAGFYTAIILIVLVVVLVLWLLRRKRG